MAAAGAQPTGGWTQTVRDKPLEELARAMNEHSWPELHAVPAPLALALHERIRWEESAGETPLEARLEAYAVIAERLGAARGYSNLVLANALGELTVHHIAALLAANPRDWQRAETGLARFAFPLSAGAPAEAGGEVLKTGWLLRRKNPDALAAALRQTDALAAALPAMIAAAKAGKSLKTEGDRLLLLALDEPPLAPWDGEIRETRIGRATEAFIESPDGRHFYSVEKLPGGERLTVDGKPGAIFDTIREVRFSPDGKRVAFIAHSRGRDALMLDGREAVSGAEIGGLAFSPDGKRVAYMIRRANGWFAVNGPGEEGPFALADTATGIVFSADGRAWAFVTGSPRVVTVILPDSAVQFPVQGKLEARPWFSDDGRRAGVLERFPSVLRFSVLDLAAGQVEQYVDGNRFAVSRDLRQARAVPGAGAEPVDFGESVPRFQVDMRAQGPSLISLRVENRDTAYYEGVAANARPHWDAPDRFHFLAERYGEVLLVEVTAPSPAENARAKAEGPGTSERSH